MTSAANVPDTSLRRFEFGGQATYVGLADCYLYKGCTQFGGGVGASVNVNRFLAIDSSFNLMPGIHNGPVGGNPAGPILTAPISEFLTGVRVEARARRWGLTANAKPGVVTWNIGTPHWYTGAPPVRSNDLAIEFGGGVEYSPSARLHFRGDWDHLYLKYHDISSGFCYPCFSASLGWVDNARITAGAYWSVGKPLAWTPIDVRAAPKHRFFDKTNSALLGVSLLAQISDGITTQRFIRRGINEGSPLAKPFVDNGWGGMIAGGMIFNGGEVALMYGLHRLHQHWLERIVPLASAAESTADTYHNVRIE